MEQKTLRISYSALDTFKQCPLKYKFQVIDKIKAPKTKEAIFGSVLHEALEWFHKQTPVFPTSDELLNFLKINWRSDIFTPEEDMIYFSEAIKILKNYYENYLKLKTIFPCLAPKPDLKFCLKTTKQKKKNVF